MQRFGSVGQQSIVRSANDQKIGMARERAKGMVRLDKKITVSDNDVRYADTSMHDCGKHWRNVAEFARTHDVRWMDAPRITQVADIIGGGRMYRCYELATVQDAYLFINTVIHMQGWDKDRTYASLTCDQDYHDDGPDGMPSSMWQVWKELKWIDNGNRRIDAHIEAVQRGLRQSDATLPDDVVRRIAHNTFAAEHSRKVQMRNE